MFSDKKILVCGMAKSGQAVARLLVEMGANVYAQDKNTDIHWELPPEGFHQYLGQDPIHIVGEFDLVIISPGIPVDAPFVEKAKSLEVPVWGEAEFAYRLCPCPMIAITGTNGKTTVTTLVGDILKLHNPGTVVGGNIGTPLTNLVTSLSPNNIVVAEISSFQLETIAAFRPHISAVLNMTEDHLDRHYTMENYIAMKSRIFENQQRSNICVLNYDNPITREMKPPSTVLYFSAKETLKSGVFLRDGYIIAKSVNGQEKAIAPITSTLAMAENALAATALCLCAGVPPELIAQGLQAFKGVEHRLEFVATKNNIHYYNDSKATNTDSGMKAIEAINGSMVLIGGGYDKHTDFTPWVQSFGTKVTHLVIIGQTTEKIVDTCEKLGFTNYTRASTLAEAVDIASAKASPGSHVVFSPACASFDMFKNFEVRGHVFKDYVHSK